MTGTYVYATTYYFITMTGRGFPRPSLWFMGVMRGCELWVVRVPVCCVDLVSAFVVGSGFYLGLCMPYGCGVGFKQLYILEIVL